ncbi:hypothetical protein PXO_02113 [Xanthomonas oryzae pv. oryzae PXO99A]|uniref:Uncharacterized protein n=1 Tax=Xanthomonas oryzae pv. oryzae (strain PXO99A) TaxID=360094 RepID=A0A0K0GML0_XANOP|nr:hypothetical protein PXO_02113 [Xanthomonas oryzae pv. oryzae PXO99A]
MRLRWLRLRRLRVLAGNFRHRGSIARYRSCRGLRRQRWRHHGHIDRVLLRSSSHLPAFATLSCARCAGHWHIAVRTGN